MIDISNKTIDELNVLITKYASALEQIPKNERDAIPYLAVVFDIAVPYIKEKYPDLDSHPKAWATYVLKLLLHYLKNDADIKRVIDEFFVYYKNEYPNYGTDIVLSASQYDRDHNFVYNYAATRKVW
jgi:hypothetical protein